MQSGFIVNNKTVQKLIIIGTSEQFFCTKGSGKINVENHLTTSIIW